MDSRDANIAATFTEQRPLLRGAEALLGLVASAHADGTPNAVGPAVDLPLALEGIRHLVRSATDALDNAAAR